MNAAQLLYIVSTHKLPIGQKAHFYFSNLKSTPLLLFKQHEDYLLFRVLPYANAAKLQDKVKGRILIEIPPNSAIFFETEIVKTLKINDQLYLKISHSNHIKYLSRRKSLRVPTDIISMAKRLDKNNKAIYSVTIRNISTGGVKFSIDGNIFEKKERLFLRFQLNQKYIEAVIEVLEKNIVENEVHFNAKFIQIDSESAFAIDKFIQINAKTVGLSPYERNS